MASGLRRWAAPPCASDQTRRACVVKCAIASGRPRIGSSESTRPARDWASRGVRSTVSDAGPTATIQRRWSAESRVPASCGRPNSIQSQMRCWRLGDSRWGSSRNTLACDHVAFRTRDLGQKIAWMYGTRAGDCHEVCGLMARKRMDVARNQTASASRLALQENRHTR